MLAYRTFAAAPHRMLFFGGALALNLALLAWLVALLGRFGYVPAASLSLPPGPVHGWLLVFGAFPFFVFGFLMTALPRWVSAPGVEPQEYQPVAFLLYIGFLLVLLGAVLDTGVPVAGMAITALGLLGGLGIIWRVLVRAGMPLTSDPVLAAGLLALGCLGALLSAAGAYAGNIGLFRAGLNLGLWGFLVPVVFTVGHRMLPFFAGNAVAGYTMHRTAWGSPVVAALCLVHGVLLSAKAGPWLLATAGPLSLVTLYHWLLWRPWQTRGQPLLWTAFAALLWLPVAGALYVVQSAVGWLDPIPALGRAPLHAAAVGLMGGVVLAMATRVSRGHSGRSLRMDALEVTAFLTLQGAALARVIAEFPGVEGFRGGLLIAAAALWLAAFLPWGWRYGRIYWQPRLDGAPG